MQPTIKVVPDVAAIVSTAAEIIVESAKRAIADHGKFSLALSGGSTPKPLYELLASDAYVRKIDWANWEIYFSDERCVPPVHPDSNYRMADQALLEHVALAPENIHRMKGEIEPQQAAIEYGKLLKAKFGPGGLDMALLGMGDNGHTASLFPNTVVLDEKEHRCAATFVPELGKWRITMTAPFLNRTRETIVLVAGANKASRVQEVLEGPSDPKRLPIQLIQPVDGKILWLMDVAAAGME